MTRKNNARGKKGEKVPIPPVRVKYWDAHYWQEMPNDERFILLGICPAPLGYCPWRTFRHHVLHGLLMGYPLWSVLRWSWRNRRGWE